MRGVTMQGDNRRDGHVPGPNGIMQQANSMGSRRRMPTVNEALPFTPFASIVPFNPDIIPAPLAIPQVSRSIPSFVENKQAVQNVLNELSAGANSAEKASKRCQKTLLDLRQLLDPENAPQFKFKKPRHAPRSQPLADESKQVEPVLSDFAKMLLKSTPLGFRYLTPESPKAEDDAKSNGIRSLPSAVTTNHASKTYAPQPQRHDQRIIDPTTFVSSQDSRVQAVIVPKALTAAQRAEYQYVSDKPGESVAANRSVNIDQRQRGDGAVQVLASLLSDIFDTEDQLQSGLPHGEDLEAEQMFVAMDSDDGTVLTLQQPYQERLDSAVQKVASYSRFDSVPVEDIVRLQKLCERGVSSMASLDFTLSEDASMQDAEEWQHKLAIAERGLLAGKTLLRIMTAGRQEKELQSEDLVRIILSALKVIIETILVPIVEERSTIGEKVRGGEKAQINPKFAITSSNRKTLQTLLSGFNKTLRLLGGLLVKVDVDETALSSVLFMCKTLIFAENAPSEKDSILGVQNFEATRKLAMDVMARLFTRYTQQRQYIFDEILLSLEKLPATKQSARQYRLPDTKPIQLVSALLMRLVQTSATRGQVVMQMRTSKADENDEDDEDAAHSDEDESSSDESEYDGDTVKVSKSSKSHKDPQNIDALVKPLQDAAQRDASYVVRMLIQRALTTSKSSDEPYRKLLDIFTEDFLTVLGSTDWPAAELLLRTLLGHMLSIAQNNKSPVPSRNLALELLGTMGSGILELQMRTRNIVRSLSPGESAIAAQLATLARELEYGSANPSRMLSFDGPYRIVLEHLHSKGANDAQLQSAKGFHMTQWAQDIASALESPSDPEDRDPANFSTVKANLANMVKDPQWLEEHFGMSNVSTAESKVAAALLTLNSTFCKAFNNLLNLLLTSMMSEHSTMKSRALKSVVTLLEKDPSLLDRNKFVLPQIFRCADDASPLVRDSALSLIAKCISLRPELDTTVYKQVVVRTEDPANGVRKRAIKMLKDIYLRNDSGNIRSVIAKAIISRIKDTEESVNELARQTMEEIWFAPFHNAQQHGDASVQARLKLQQQAALIVETTTLGESVLEVLGSLLRELLTKSKSSVANSAVCKSLVDILFEGIIDTNDIPGNPSQDLILQALTVFSKTSPRLFGASQLEQLEPYTNNLKTQEDLDIFRSVLTILRHTMHHITTLKHDFLTRLQNSLMAGVPRLPKAEVAEVVSCLWTIDGELQNTSRLVGLMTSVLSGILAKKAVDFSLDEQNARKAIRLMHIAGQVGKTCDLEEFLPAIQAKLPRLQSNTVSGLAVELLCEFTTPKQPLEIREASLENICAICQRWPKQFLRTDVLNAFQIVLHDRIPTLEHVLLVGLVGFFATQEKPEGSTENGEDETITGRERLARTYVATDEDGAAASLTQRFLQDVIRLALASYDDQGLVATRLTATIVRQGLPHPKECGPAMVALETSPNAAIARMAFEEHRTLHQKHESMIEKEYMRAIQQAFAYQRTVAGDSKGFTGQPPVSKLRLFWDVLKGGKPKVRQKFITNIAQKLGINPADARGSAHLAETLAFTRFCVENLAFFDYDRIDDLLLLVNSLEKTFAGSGTTIAQTIESEVLRLQIDMGAQTHSFEHGMSEAMMIPPAQMIVDPARLTTLTLSSQILLLVWETRTYIVRLWLLQKLISKNKAATKEISKAPSRATNAPSLTDAYIKRIEQLMLHMDNPEDQRQMCSRFVEVISVDHEAKVPSEGEDNDDMPEGFDGESGGASYRSPSAAPSVGGGGKKRKSSISNGTPRKRKDRLKKSNSMRSMDGEDDDADWD